MLNNNINNINCHIEHVITDKCNLSCVHCYKRRIFQERHDLDVSELKAFYEQFLPHAVNFTGGEPLLYEGICELVDYLISCNSKVSLQTNGLLLNNLNLTKLSGANITISIDGFEKTHKNIRNTDNFNSLISLAKENANIKVNCVIQERNINEVNDLAGYFHENNIRFNFLLENFITEDEAVRDDLILKKIGSHLKTIPVCNNCDNIKISWFDNIMKLFSKYPAINFSFSEKHVSNYLDKNNTSLVCQKINKNRLRISPDGEIFFCEHIDLSFGNIKKISPVEVTESNKYKILKDFLDNEKLNICKRCCKSR